MSAKISGKVWELDLEPTEKLVLLALADHADHEGNNVRPGNDLLVAKTGLSQQTISAKITKFIEMGILEPTKDGRGRGVIREFSIEPERAERKPFFIEREERKLQAARTYRKMESYRQGVPFEAERYNLTEKKVQPDSEKVQSDKIAYKEHEPSIEPSIEPSLPPSAQRPKNELYEIFANHYRRAYGCPYQNKKADFVQLSACQKQGGEWLTTDRWLIAVGNYLASPMSNHTLADLSSRFGAFFRSALDRYAKPVTTQTAFSQKTQNNLAAAQAFLARHGLRLEDAA